MSLESRMESFGRLCDRFPCDKPSWCVADYKIPDEQFKNLQSAIAIYMSKGLPNQKLFTDDESIMSEYERVRAIDRSLIKNCNPNGMLVPKKENSLEYNAVVKAYMEIMNTMNVRDLIPSYHVPLNMRYKDGIPRETDTTRVFATERTHSDSWAGETPISVTTIFSILGDTENNFVKFYEPPSDFSEEWIRPLKGGYVEGEGIAAKYKPLDITFRKGHVYLADFANLHASRRNPGCRARVSIDTTFALMRSEEEMARAAALEATGRTKERLSYDTLSQIGISKAFYFPQSIHDPISATPIHKHYAILRLVDLESGTDLEDAEKLL